MFFKGLQPPMAEHVHGVLAFSQGRGYLWNRPVFQEPHLDDQPLIVT